MIPDFNFSMDELADNIVVDKDLKTIGAQAPAVAPVTSNQVTEAPVTEQPAVQPTEQPAAPVAQAPQVYKEADYVQEIFNAYGNMPQPTVDPTREKRLTALAGAGGVAKALSTLGDAFALGKGGIIPTRQFSSTDPYVGQILQDKKELQDQQYQAKLREHAEGLRRAADLAGAKGRDVARAERADDKELANFRYEEQKAIEEKRYKDAQTGKEKQEARQKEIDALNEANIKADNKRADRQVSVAESNSAISAVKAAAALAATEAKKKGKEFQLQSSDGKIEVPIGTSGELQAVYSAILSDKDPVLRQEAMDRIKLLQSQMQGGESINAQQIIATEFWERSPKAIAYLKGKGLIQEAGGAITPTTPAATPPAVPNMFK